MMDNHGILGVEQDPFHPFRHPQDHTASSYGKRILYNSQPVTQHSSILPSLPSPPAVDSRLLLSLAKFCDTSTSLPIPASPDKHIGIKGLLYRDPNFSEDARLAPTRLHEHLISTQETPSRTDPQLSTSSLLLLPQLPMDHDRLRDQQQPPSQDQPPASGINLAYGLISDHTGTATSNVNLTGSGPSSDLSASSFPPYHRPPRLSTQHRSMHTLQPHPNSLPSAFGPNAPYYPSQQTQGQNAGQPQQQQQQQQQHHYMSQPMSPTIYYPTFPHMHQQTTSPGAYNVNQGYMSQVPTSAGSSMHVSTYAYSHPYAHVSDHPMHSFAYPGLASMPLYSEADPLQQQQQQMQNRGSNMDMMSGYMPVMGTTGPAYGYSISAYAPTGGSIFTPQYSSYNYNPSQLLPFHPGYGQAHQGSRPPPLNLSQHQAPGPGSSHIGLEHPQTSPLPPNISNTHGGTGAYSPIVVPPSPGVFTPVNRPNSIGRVASGSDSFGLGLNPGISNSLSGYGSSGLGSPGDALAPVRTARAPDSSSSTLPSDTNSGPDAEGEQPKPSTAAQHKHGASLTRGDRQDGQQGTGKGERSDWVMWVGNVPGDANLHELYTFFGQGPPVPEAERKCAENGYQPFQMELLPQLEGAALEPDPRDDNEVGGADVGVGGLSGVISVFLISRSNCAFVNYVSEESLLRGVEYFNGRPLRDPQVDPRCPKLVCRVRKKGDDVKAGVGGQRGVGTHARWVKEKKAAEAKAPTAGDGNERPPLVHGGPAANVKKSSSGSSVSYASTTSSMLQKYFPERYFILKSLTQHDLDLSVERGLWATQIHNQEVLDQAYRTSQTVYLIFGVNKSGEFFGYAKMDGPISQVERNPSIEWAARDSVISPSSAKSSPVVTRRAPSQPTIQEAPDQEEDQGLNLAPPNDDNENLSIKSSDDVVLTDERQNDPHRFSSVPLDVAKPARRSLAGGELFARGADRKAVTLPHHQVSEPVQRLRRHDGLSQFSEQKAAPPPLPEQAYYSPTQKLHPSMARLFTGSSLQESPDPLTPGEDQKLHSLEHAKPMASVDGSSHPSEVERNSQQGTESSNLLERNPTAFSIASAPAVMIGVHKPLSVSSPIISSDTWDERRKNASMWTKEHSIEEEAEMSNGIVPVPLASASLPAESLLVPLNESDEMSTPLNIDLPPVPVASLHLPKPDINPDSSSSNIINTTQKEEMPASDLPAATRGREEGWGTPFKIKWIRTNPLLFQRTRHLRNPWNHDREIKVSRDGTEVEPGVGQRLLEEWERPEPAVATGDSGFPPKSPISFGGPPSPVQPFPSKGRGRGRGGWAHRDAAQ